LKEQINYQDTLVAFFDIHAYSEFINSTTDSEAIEKIKKLYFNIRENARVDFGSVKLDLSILSDSIILVIDTNRAPIHAGSLNLFFATCSSIM